MSAKNKCCVCKIRPACKCNWYPVCDEKSCNAIYHICFSGVADGANHAKMASLASLQFAAEYLRKSSRPQKTLLAAVEREISKRSKGKQP